MSATAMLVVALSAMYVFTRPTLGCGPVNTFKSGVLPLRTASTVVSQSVARSAVDIPSNV